MNEPSHKPWLRAAIIVALLFAIAGIVFALPSAHVQVWRLAAWGVSALVYGSHILYEHFRLRNRDFPSAVHVALAAALGAFGLAVSANIHAMSADSSEHRQLLLLSLVLWPLFTAIPAFLVTLSINAVLSRVFRTERN